MKLASLREVGQNRFLELQREGLLMAKIGNVFYKKVSRVDFFCHFIKAAFSFITIFLRKNINGNNSLMQQQFCSLKVVRSIDSFPTTQTFSFPFKQKSQNQLLIALMESFQTSSLFYYIKFSDPKNFLVTISFVLSTFIQQAMKLEGLYSIQDLGN